MYSKILAALLFFSVAALADPPPTNDEMDAAVARGHDASIRVQYHAQEATIAERDTATARIVRDGAQAVGPGHSRA